MDVEMKLQKRAVMNDQVTFWKRLKQMLTGDGHRSHGTEQQKYRDDQVLLLKMLMLSFIVIIALMIFVRIVEDNYRQAVADTVFIVSLGAAFFVLQRNSGAFTAIARFVMAAALTTVFISHGINPGIFSPILWIGTTVYLMFFLFSRQEAWLWLGGLIILIMADYALGLSFHRFLLQEILIWVGNLLLMALVLTWYVVIKEEKEENYRENRILLEHEISRQTVALAASNNSLLKLNESLEQRIQEEIEKNREKDHLIFNQSKSVQMGEMLNMIAHQWRQPLNAISASAIGIEMQQELGGLTPEAIIEHSDFVQKQTQQMSKTINDFMNFFKPEHERKSFYVHELMDEIVSLMGMQLKSRGISLRYDKQSPIIINGYLKELAHVMINLIANARDAYESVVMDEKPIDISFFEDAECWRIKVEDHAGGIPEELLEKVFDPYFTTKEQGKGTGIGLYMVRRIVKEIFSGTIEVSNSANGACFEIVIPIPAVSAEAQR
jgi:signal transduction histidine kinase